MANWLLDTLREVTSLGRAKTETYNKTSSSAPARRVSAPTPSRVASTTTSPRTGGGGGGGLARAVSAPVVAPPRVARVERVEPLSSRATSKQAPPAPRADAAATQRALNSYRVDPGLSGAEAAAQQQQMVGRAAMAQLDPESTTVPETPVLERPERRAQLAASAAGERSEVGGEGWSGAEAIAKRDAGRAPRISGRVEVRELTDDEYLALTPRQRAAVQYNTGLVQAAEADRAGDRSTTNVQSYLSELDLPAQDLDAFLRLDRAIGDNVLRALEDPTARSQSAESRRLARGNAAAAPLSRLTAAGQDAAANAAAALQTRLANGFTGLRGDAQAPGMTDSMRDQVLRMAWDFMVDSSVEQSPQDIAEGLSQLNANMGTDIAPQELWDFARMQLDAADFGALRNADVTVPVTDETIVPLSVADIRARYGI